MGAHHNRPCACPRLPTRTAEARAAPRRTAAVGRAGEAGVAARRRGAERRGAGEGRRRASTLTGLVATTLLLALGLGDGLASLAGRRVRGPQGLLVEPPVERVARGVELGAPCPSHP